MASSKGYNTRAYVSAAPGAFAIIQATDFGTLAPALVNGDLAYNSGAGSLPSGTAYVKIAWITAEGISLPSAEASVAVSASSGAVTVTLPAVPTNGQPIIGWRIYESGTTGTELHVVTASATPAQQSFVTTTGTFVGFPIATTSAQIKIAGSGAAPNTVDNSGIQYALPSVPANSTVDYYAIVPNTSSQWKVQKSVNFMRSDGTTETAGIVLSHLDCISPEYPGVSTAVSVGPGSFFVMNGYLFEATTAGTTAVTFIGYSKFNTTEGATTTDGTVVWTSHGKAALIRFLFGNVSGSAATPVAQTYELFEQ
jgi:hypothetical protein